jgi:hypothetical protein
MPQTLTTTQIQQHIDSIKTGGVDQARAVYDNLNAQGYNYAGWAAGVARGDSITGLSALSYLQGTAMMGMGGDACRNLTQAQIDKVRVDMATGYLETLKIIATDSGGSVNRDVKYSETEKFHKDAFETNRLTLDNWTLKIPMDLIRATEGDAAVERMWEDVRDTGGTGLDSILESTLLLQKVYDALDSLDPDMVSRAQSWMEHVPGPLSWEQISRFLDIFGRLMYDEIASTDPLTGMPTHDIDPNVNTRYNSALNWVWPRDPLVLDLDGNGITTTPINPNAPLLFDQDGDGTLTATGWIGAGEALVVRDLNANGRIDSGRELFGDSTVLTSGTRIGQKAANGFEALADLDSNADGKFDAADTAFASVKLWKDANQNGISEAGELFAFADQGVASINVTGTASNVDLGGGNTQSLAGSFTRTNGQTGNAGTAELAGSLLLANNNFYREFTDDPQVTSAAAALPQMRGSGWVRDLREAMSLGTAAALELQQKVSAFGAATTRDAQMALLDGVIEAWGKTATRVAGDADLMYGMGLPLPLQGSADVAPITSRFGAAMDAKGLDWRSVHGAGAAETLGNMLVSAGLAKGWQWGGTDNTGYSSFVIWTNSAAEAFATSHPEQARLVQTLESFNGATLLARFTISGNTIGGTVQNSITALPQPVTNLLGDAYAALKDSVYGALALQTRLQPYLDSIGLVIDDTWSAV